MNTTIDDFESQRAVHVVGRMIVDQAVRSHLDTALRTRPRLGSFEQLAPYPAAATLGAYKPPFNETGGLRGVASIRMRTQAYQQEPGQRAGLILRDEQFARQRAGAALVDHGLGLFAKFFGQRTRPEQSLQLHEFSLVAGSRFADPSCDHVQDSTANHGEKNVTPAA